MVQPLLASRLLSVASRYPSDFGRNLAMILAKNIVDPIAAFIIYWRRSIGRKRAATFDIWDTYSKSVGARDKLLKVVQYAFILLIHCYKTTASEEILQRMNSAKLGASMGRKAFRLFRTINHVSNISKYGNKIDFDLDLKSLTSLRLYRLAHLGATFMEDVGLGLYFFFDNQVYANNTKLMAFDVPLASRRASISNFLADLGSVFAALIQLKLSGEYVTEAKEQVQKLKILKHKHPESHSKAGCDELLNRIGDLELKIAKYMKNIDTAYQDLLVAIFEIAVSANCSPIFLWKRLCGGKSPVHEGHEGLCGIASALLVLYGLWPEKT